MKSMTKVQFAALAATLALSGCAGVTSGAPPEAQVKERADARWGALRAKNFRAAYTYLTPAQRALITQDSYLNTMGDGNSWLATEVVGVTCEQQSCVATVAIDVAPPVPRKFGDKLRTHVYENWVLVDGQWWFNQK